MNAHELEAAILATATDDPPKAASLALALERVELARFWRAMRKNVARPDFLRAIPKVAEALNGQAGTPGEEPGGACQDRWVEAQIQGTWPPLLVRCPKHNVPERTPCPDDTTSPPKGPPS